MISVASCFTRNPDGEIVVNRHVDLSHEVFGILHVKHKVERSSGVTGEWWCECECGEQLTISVTDLIRNGVCSCGCIGKKPRTLREKMNGIWRAMKSRCHNKKNKAYKWYGQRGISVCESWKESFESFCEDMGKPPSDCHTLDREDNDGNYTPDNCRWATYEEQANNRRRCVA